MRLRRRTGRASSMKLCFVASNRESGGAGHRRRDEVQGFVIARVVGREWEIENIAIAGFGPAAWAGHASAGRASGYGPSAEARRRSFWKCANPTARRGRSMKSGRSSKAGAAGRYYKDPEEDAILYRLDFILSCTSVGAELFTMKSHSSVEIGLKRSGAVW